LASGTESSNPLRPASESSIFSILWRFERNPIIDTNVDKHGPVSQGPAPVAALAEQNRMDGQPAIEEPQPTDLALECRGVLRAGAPLSRPHVAFV